ncbi:MAG: RrF2 family transcriptional regulator [Pseudomonas sp.]
MRKDSRLSRMLHVLLHMDGRDKPLSSDVIAGMLTINPGIVRRTMGDLRIAGLVSAAKGHGGGWMLARSLGEINLLTVYLALGEPTIFALGPTIDSASCGLEIAANASLQNGLSQAADTFRTHLASVTLADLIVGASGVEEIRTV